MSYLSMGMSLVRQWFPEVAPWAPVGIRPQGPLPVELNGTVGISRAGGDRVGISISGLLRAQAPDGALPGAEDDEADLYPRPGPGLLRRETRLESRRCSSAALAGADPLVWIQLLDDRGVPLTHETFLGRGVGVEYKFRARIEVATRGGPRMAVEADDRMRAPHRSPSRTRLATGLHARVVMRTYRNPAGPSFQMEALELVLQAAGTDLPARSASIKRALALVPGSQGVPASGAESHAPGAAARLAQAANVAPPLGHVVPT